VTRWIQRGRIAVEDNGRIDPEKADRMRALTESELPHHQARKAQIELEKQMDRARSVDAAEPDSEEVSKRLKMAMMREREAKAEAAALELDKQVGLLVERGEVEHLLKDFGATLTGLVESLADRLAPVVAGRQGDNAAIHADIERAARELLEEMEAHMRRNAQTKEEIR